jgi:glycosyltransferase involved in cell wall biosynthesis
MELLDYSIVVPVYNSVGSLEELLERIHLVFEENGHSFEIICVNDASNDGSWELLQSIKESANYNLTLIQFSINYGQHKALLCGLGFAKGTASVLIDSDLQIPPEEINKLIQRKEETDADVIYGEYHQKQHSNTRNRFSELLGWILKKYGSYQARGSSFKLIDKKIVDKIINTNFEYIFIDELLSWHTSDFEYTNITHLQRETGKSSYTKIKLVKMALNIILNYTTLPLRMMAYGGLYMGAICFFIGVYFIINKLVYGTLLGFTAIIVSILFSTGLILFCLGIIGEYIKKIYFVQSAKPPFTIKKVIK